jgi:hypothetical protein
MVALIDWDETPEATRSKIQSMVDARQAGTRPQRLSGTEETYLQQRGLGSEPEPRKPSLTEKLFANRRR